MAYKTSTFESVLFIFPGALRNVCEQTMFTPRAERQKLPKFQYNSSITDQQIFQNMSLLNWWSELPEPMQYYLPPKRDFACDEAPLTATKLKTAM